MENLGMNDNGTAEVFADAMQDRDTLAPLALVMAAAAVVLSESDTRALVDQLRGMLADMLADMAA